MLRDLDRLLPASWRRVDITQLHRIALAAAVVLAGFIALLALFSERGGSDRPASAPMPDAAASLPRSLIQPGRNAAPILDARAFRAPGTPPAAGDGKLAERLPAADAKPRSTGPEPFEMIGPFTFLDGTTFEDKRVRVTLADVASVPRHATCVDGEGKLWGCGLRARAALANQLQRQTLSCHGDLSTVEPIIANCRTAAGDLASALVLIGFARPARADRFVDEERLARSQGAGLWNGGWTVRSAEGSSQEPATQVEAPR